MFLLYLLPPLSALQFLNPAYWQATHTTAQHLQNAIPSNEKTLLLANDPKLVYYVPNPRQLTFIGVTGKDDNQGIGAMEIASREAAAKLNIPNFVFLDAVQTPLQKLDITANSCDVAVCVHALDDVPTLEAQLAIQVLTRCLKPGGRFIWVGKPTCDFDNLASAANLEPMGPGLPYALDDKGLRLGVARKPADSPRETNVNGGRSSRAERRRGRKKMGKKS